MCASPEMEYTTIHRLTLPRGFLRDTKRIFELFVSFLLTGGIAVLKSF